MATRFFAGYNGRCKAGSQILRVKSWQVSVSAEEADITYARTAGSIHAGFGDSVSFLPQAEVSLSANWNSEDDPFGAPADIRPGEYVTLTLYVDKTNINTHFWRFSCCVLRCTMTVSVRAAVEYSITGKSSGQILYPRT